MPRNDSAVTVGAVCGLMAIGDCKAVKALHWLLIEHCVEHDNGKATKTGLFATLFPL
jgi:hypothetical protein